MGITKHDRGAEKLAKAWGTEYNEGKGPDVRTPARVAEYEIDPNKFSEGIQQLQGFKKPRYLAVPNESQLIKSALQKTEGTKVGVVTETGRIIKRAKSPEV